MQREVASNTEKQLAQLTTLLHELRTELQEAKADIALLKEHFLKPEVPKRKYAVITLPFTYELDEPAIQLTEDDWSRVKRGETVQLISKGLELSDEETLMYRWTFTGGIGGRVRLDVLFGNEGEFETEQEERLTADLIDEFDVPDSC